MFTHKCCTIYKQCFEVLAHVRTTVHISTPRQQPTIATIHILDMAVAMNHRQGAESCLGGQIIPHLLWNPTVHNTPPQVPILN